MGGGVIGTESNQTYETQGILVEISTIFSG